MKQAEVAREEWECVAGVEVGDTLEVRDNRKGREGPWATVETLLL